MSTFSVPVGVGPNLIISPFTDRSKILNPSFGRTQLGYLSNHGPFLRGKLGMTRFGLGQVPFPDPDTADGIVKDLFGRVEMFLYTIADAAVSGSSDALTADTATKQSDWLSGITNGMETVLKVLKGGLSALHVPYSYGFAIILLTVLVKAATFPLTKKQVESAMAMRSLAPQIKAIQELYAGDQERIQLETARLYKLAGINPLAGCLPTLATIPIWIGLYRALSNVADEGLLTEGFFWIPSLAGPTTVAARQTGSGTSWLFPFVDGHPPLGWSDTLAYLVLPVLLVITQYISVQIMQPSQSNDPNLKTSQAITKFLPLMIGYFALSVPSGLSIYWFTNNILSTAQQVWLQKLGGAQTPLKRFDDDIDKKKLSQIQKSISEATTTIKVDKGGEKLTSEGPRPGERFKRIKEQEARRRQQQEEEKRKIEEAAARITNGEVTNEVNLVGVESRSGQVQLQLLTATVKLFLKKPTEGPQQMIQVVLNNATVETDNPDLRDRAYIYWRLLSTDPEAAKDVVLAEKPVISDDSNQIDPSVLDELLANIATLSSIYQKPPEAFVTRIKTTQKTEEDDYADGSEMGYSESPAHAVDSGASPPPTSSATQYAAKQPAAAAAAPAAPALVPDLLDLGLDNNNAIVSVDQPTTPAGLPLPVLLPAATGQGLQISAQLVRRDGQIFYSMLFENNFQTPLDGFMIQFNKNTFGLAASGPLQVPQLQPGTSASTLLPMVLHQNISPGPPSTLLQVAVKNNQQPVWYFSDRISFLVLFTEDGRMERNTFLETWKTLPDSNEVSKDFPGIVMNSVEVTLDRLVASHMFFIAKRKHANQEVLYLSAKIPRGIPFLIEITAVIGIPGLKCAVKTPSPEVAPLFFEAIENLLNS